MSYTLEAGIPVTMPLTAGALPVLTTSCFSSLLSSASWLSS